MRRETKAERSAWTEHVEGLQVVRPKYGNVRAGKYASKHEAEVAANLAALERGNLIENLREQVSFTLVEGRGKLRPIRYVADFTYVDDLGVMHICDAKGYAKNPVYRLKKKLLKLLHGLDIEEL
jgi:Protein of unknown function (DUF1064)